MTVLFLIIAGICNGLLDSGTFHHTPKWIDPSLSWTWKYINCDVTQGYKLLGEFIPYDYWHLVN